MEQHTLKAFDTELNELAHKVVEMGGLVQKQVAGSIDALAKRDVGDAEEVMATKDTVDALQREIEDKGIVMIARRQPVANDLREIVGASRIAHDLEHLGDIAEKIARRTWKEENGFQSEDVMLGVQRMGELVIGELNQVIDSYVHRDVAKALEVWRNDAQVDALYSSLFRELLTYMMQDPRNIGYCSHLLLSIKDIERVGDHATNIAESVVYIVEGRTLAHERSRLATTPIVAASPAAD